MKNNAPSRFLQSGNKSCYGRVTRAIVNLRTRELALRAGRTPSQVEQSDYEQAKREVTGESDPERQAEALDSPAKVAPARKGHGAK